MKDWRIDVLLGKITAFHNCPTCKTKTVWHLTIVLGIKTGHKFFEWWCGICNEQAHEDIGPFIPN